MAKRPAVGRRFSPCIILVLLATALVVYPLLPPGIPSTADGPLHLIRDVEFDAVLRSGVLYPRWAPDLAYGYGYPLFNYYAPLFYYLTEIPHLLGLGFVASLKLIIDLTLVLYGLAMYRWTRPFLGEVAAAVAGVAYVYVPFRFHEAYMQGDYPQFLALAFAPLALGALYRVMAADRVTFGKILALVLSLAALLLTHNISALWLAPTLVVYALVLACVMASRADGPLPHDMPQSIARSFRRLGFTAGAAVLSLGLTAYFWLPALAEQNLVQLYRLRTDNYDVRHSFITLAALLAPPRVVDQTAANPTPYFHLGWGQLALALATIPLLALTLWLIRRKGGAALPRFLAANFVFGWALLLTSAALTLPFSLPVWRLSTLLEYTQFPWRVLELSGLATALLAGIATHLALRLVKRRDRAPSHAVGRAGTIVVGIALLALIVPSLVYLYPRKPFLVYGPLAAPDVTAYERNGGAVGTTSTGEYYPRDVQERPRAPLPPDLNKIGRLDRGALPAGARVSFLGSSGYTERYQITLPRPATLRFDLIRFAGWQVLVDGRVVATRPSPGQGLILASVPSGAHRLTLRFVDTPVRRLGWILALLSAGAVIGAGLLSLRRRVTLTKWLARGTAGDPAPTVEPRLARRDAAALCVVPLALIALRVASPAPYRAIFARKSPLDHVLGASHPERISLDNTIEFLGYDLSGTLLKPGGKLTLTLYWRALKPLTRDYRSLAMIASIDEQNLLAQDDRPNPGGIATHTWPTDRYVVDQHTIAIPANAAPMVYQVQVALYDQKTQARLRQVGVSGGAANQIVLQRVQVLRTTPLDPSTYRALGNPVFGGEITCVGYRVSASRLQPGQTLEFTLIWRANRPVAHDYTVFTHLIDARQNQAAGDDSMPRNGQFPTSTWPVGEEVVDPHPIALPANIPPGQYHLAFGIYDAKTLKRLDVMQKDWKSPRSQVDLNGLPIVIESKK